MKKLMKKLNHYIVAALLTASLLTPVVAPTAFAACPDDAPTRGFLGLPFWWRDLACDEQGRPALASPIDTWKIVLNVIEAAMIVAGYMAVGYVIWGGFKYLTSDGDEGRLTSARKIIQNALIGLLLVLASVAMVNFVGGLL